MRELNILTRIFLYTLFGLAMLCADVTVRCWQYWAVLAILIAVDINGYIQGAWDRL